MRYDNTNLSTYQGFPDSSAGKESICNAGDLGLIPGLGRSPGEGKGCPLQYSGLENSMDCVVHGVTKSRTRLSDFKARRCISGSINLGWLVFGPLIPLCYAPPDTHLTYTFALCEQRCAHSRKAALL